MRRATVIVSGVTLRTEIPESSAERRRGLLGLHGLEPRTSMLFQRCRSVHTFGMRFPITVVVLDRDLHVLRVKTLPPNRLLWPTRKARHILECGEGIFPAVADRAELRLVDGEVKNEFAEEPRDDREDGRSGNHRERHDPADGARKRDGLAASFGSPEAEDLEQ